MRKAVNGLFIAALLASLWIRSGYSGLIAGIIGAAIGLSFRRKDTADEMDIQMELLSSYFAMAVVICFSIIMMAAKQYASPVSNAYMYVMCVAWLGWGLFQVILKKVWK